MGTEKQATAAWQRGKKLSLGWICLAIVAAVAACKPPVKTPDQAKGADESSKNAEKTGFLLSAEGIPVRVRLTRMQVRSGNSLGLFSVCKMARPMQAGPQEKDGWIGTLPRMQRCGIKCTPAGWWWNGLRLGTAGAV